MMASYLPSVKLPSFSSWTSRSSSAGTATDAPLDQLPEHESKPLSDLRERSFALLTASSANLPTCDVWAHLTESANAQLRDEVLLRFLRYNGLNVERAEGQLRQTVDWRRSSGIATVGVTRMHGHTVGLPILTLGEPRSSGDMLFFSLAEAYVRRVVDHTQQQLGVAKMFDFLLYDTPGPHVRRASVVVDFTNLSMRNVDLAGLRAGIIIYMSYFPDVFHQILFINYPKFIYGGMSASFAALFSRFPIFLYLYRCVSLHTVAPCVD